MRRVVTGHNIHGKAVIAINDNSKRVTELPNYPGYAAYEIWSTERDSLLPRLGDDPTIDMDHFVPALGETRFTIIEIPPDSEIANLVESGSIDFEQAWVEFANAFPDMGRKMEPDNSGMHTTNTIDYIVVLSGEIWCELDDGVEIHLTAGDTLVQCGTRHSWHVKGSKPCVLACIMLGVERT